MSKISETLRQLRQERGMTQEEAAEQIGLTRQAVSSYESGRTQPGLDILERLAQVYEVELTDIIYGRGKGVRLYRGLKISALVMAIIVLVLQLVSVLLLWTANHFFAIDPGPMSDAEMLIWETRTKLVNGYAHVEDFSCGLVPFFCVALLVITLCMSRPLGAKVKVFSVLGFCTASIVVTLPWALTDPVYGPANYLLMPRLSLYVVIFFLIVSLVIDFFRIRKGRKKENEN